MSKNIMLHEGLMTIKELAEWFGIKPNTLSKNKEKKLKELQKYAEFKIINKKIYITKIINPCYSKTFDIVLNHTDNCWSKTGLDSCARVSLQIQQEADLTSFKSETIYNYTRQARDLLYGKPFTTIGKLGSCVYVWCKRIEDEENKIHYEFLTDKEEKEKKRLIQKYFGDVTEKQLLVQGMIDAGEITKQQAWDVLQQLTNMGGHNFLDFLKELQTTIGCQVVRGTYVQRNQLSAF